MSEDWLDRWENGRTGWHESGGNAGLRQHWSSRQGRVLVPLCGKTPDMVWLAERGHDVFGIELADKAIREFFTEQQLSFVEEDIDSHRWFRCHELPITLIGGDYFDFAGGQFDALYDRGSIVAIDPDMRPHYVEHTRALLNPGASRLIITLEYDQNIVQGPPFALLPDELATYWDDLERVAATDDLETCPPKFRKAGLREILEVVWCSSG